MEIQRAKVVELNADYAVVLTDRGAFKRIIRKGEMSVGGGIYITEQDLYMNIATSKAIKRPLFSKRLLQMTGVMALLIMILFTQSFVPMSYAVISVDINPSIQLFIDKDYNVVKIESMNADGKNLLSEYEFVKDQSASSVLTELFTLATEMDYLKSDQNEILIAAAIYETSKADKNNLQIGSETDQLIDTILSEVDYSIFEQENVVINSVTSNTKNIEAAEKEHLTIGQYEKDNHSDTVKSYAIVEDGKPVKTKKGPNENANTPADPNNEDLDKNGDKAKDSNDIEDKDSDNIKDKDSDNIRDNDKANDKDGTNNGNNNSNGSNGNTNDANNGNNNTNGNGNIENNTNNDKNSDKNHDQNIDQNIKQNNDKNHKTEIKPKSGIDNVQSNVENSKFVKGKKRNK